MSPEIEDTAATMLTLWAGSPQDRAQVIPHLAELNRFTMTLVVLEMVSRLQFAPAGDPSIPELTEALYDASWRYTS